MFLYLLSLGPVLMTILFLLSKNIKAKCEKTREKSTPFECGFDPSHQMRSSFSLRFFVTTLLFLVFDVETAILLPLPLSASSYSYNPLLSTNSVIFFLLTMGLLLEWTQGALDWSWAYI